MPPAGSDMAAQVFKDPHLFDFLDTADPHREREVEQTLIDHIRRFFNRREDTNRVGGLRGEIDGAELCRSTRYVFKTNRRTDVIDLYESSS